MQYSKPPHHYIASTTDRFIQVGYFALHLHNPDEPTSVFFQVSHYIFRINFFTATLASYHASSSLFHNTTASGLHISTGNLCHSSRQLTALPPRRVTLSACHFSDNSSSQPFHHQPFHQSTATNCPAVQFPSQPPPQSISHDYSLYTIYRVTDNRFNSRSQFIDPLHSTVQSFYNPMIHRIMIRHLKIQPFQKTSRSKV